MRILLTGAQAPHVRRNAAMSRSVSGWLLLLALAAPATASAADVVVAAAGNHASADVTLDGVSIAELNLTFDDAGNLSPAALGVSADLVGLNDPLLRLRLPGLGLQTPLSALPLLITVEPPNAGALNLRNSVRVEIHTHVLPYLPGSRLRLFKAPLGGAFADITDEIAPGSVRTRGTTGGFSQFLLLVDLRSTGSVITAKFTAMRALTAMLPLATRAPLDALLADAELAVTQARYADAIAALDTLRAQVAAGAGSTIPNEWNTALRDGNIAGELLGGAASLRFSVGFRRDHGN
jgi:hypothetical protein